MSFWQTSDNQDSTKTGTSFESGGGNLEPIPGGTQLKACIDEAKWDEYEGSYFISLRWTVLDGEFKGRKVFHKIRARDTDAKKADKAKRMLAAIATNAGGGLFSVHGEPEDQDLTQHLTNKPMAILVQVWEMEGSDGQMRSGNWVSAVSPLNGPAKPPAPPASTGGGIADEDIPFARIGMESMF